MKFLDINFERFLSLHIIRICWGVVLIFTPLAVIGAIIYQATADSPNWPLLLIGYPFFGLLMIVWARVILETFAVLFRIADNTGKLVRNGQPGPLFLMRPEHVEAETTPSNP